VYTLIAATALERNLTVIIADHDFERVPGLRVQILTTKMKNKVMPLSTHFTSISSFQYTIHAHHNHTEYRR
jgi:hypothetical protein